VSGDELTDVATQVLEASRMLGEDGAANTESFARALQVMNVDSADAAGAADMFFVASQKYGVGFDKITSQVQTFGPVLQNAGFSIEETTDLFGQMNAAGIDLTRIMPGMNAATRKWAAEGLNAKDMLDLTITAMADAETNAEALTIATEAFGAEGAQRMVTAAREGELSISDLGDALEDTQGTISDTASETDSFGEKFGRFKNKMMVLLEPLATKIFDTLGVVFEKVAPYIERSVNNATAWVQDTLVPAFQELIEKGKEIRDKLKPYFEKVKTAVKNAVDAILKNWPKVVEAFESVSDWVKDNERLVKSALVGLGIAAAGAFLVWAVNAAAAAAATLLAMAPVVLVAAAVAALAGAVVYAYNNFEWFREAVGAVASFFTDTVWPALQAAAAGIVAAFNAVVGFVVEYWPTLMEIIGAFVAWFMEYVWPTIQSTIDLIVAAFNLLVEGVLLALDLLTEIITIAIDVIMVLWDTFGEHLITAVTIVWDLIKGIVEVGLTIIRGVIDVVTGLISGNWGIVWNGILTVLTGVWDGIKLAVSTAIDAVALGISTVMDGIKLAWETVWGAVSTFVSDKWDDIKGFVETGINGVVDFVTELPGRIVSAVSGAFDGLKDAFKTAVNFIIDGWNGISFSIPGFKVGPIGYDGFTLSTPNIPRMAMGGVAAGGLTRVGERGPEDVYLPKGARVVPNHASKAGGDVIVNVQTQADPFEIGREVAWNMKTAGV